MTKRDIVICAGDFGGVWFGDGRDEAALDWLESLPFTLAFVCGNHENYDALERYPVKDWHGGKVHRIRSHVLHLMRGQVFELEGYHFFTMGGAPDAAEKAPSEVSHQSHFVVGAGDAF